MAEKIFAKQPDHGIVFLWLDFKGHPRSSHTRSKQRCSR